MRLKVKRLLSGAVLLHIVFFTWFLHTIYDTRTTFMGIQGNVFLHGDLREKVTSRVQNETNTSKDYTAAQEETKQRQSEFPLDGGDCPNATFPDGLNREEGWYRVDDVRRVYVFSAYYDERSNNTMKILGAKTTARTNLICQFWIRHPDGTRAAVVESVATATMLPEGHGRRYTVSIITCSVRRGLIPDTVAIVTQKCATPLHLLTVQRILDRPYKRNFTVCLTPFNFRYGKAYELVEWIELNRILGAEHFTFYNYSSARNIGRVLEHYKDQGLVDIVNWNLPMGVDTWPRSGNPIEIHYFGQLGALNDCWRRNRQESEYLVYVDLDEFIVPRGDKATTWGHMLSMMPSSSAYIFRNVFFRKEWNDPNLTFSDIPIARDLKLVTVLKTVRERHMFPYNMRSKYIVRSDSALTLGIHNIPNLQPRAQQPFRVLPDVGLLHHYRNWEQPDDKEPRTSDNTIVLKYKDALVKNVKETWSKLPGVDMNIPIV